MSNDHGSLPNKSFSDTRARQAAREILWQLHQEIGDPHPPFEDGELPPDATKEAYRHFTPELEAVYHDTIGLLEGIAEGLIPAGQPRITSNLIQIISNYTAPNYTPPSYLTRDGSFSYHDEAVNMMIQCLQVAAREGVSADAMQSPTKFVQK